MRFEEPEKTLKICQTCGKLEMMTQKSRFCAECKKQRYKARSIERYWANREEILAKKHKNKAPKVYAKHEKRRIYPVVFNCKDGRYSWQVNFKNPLTGHNVVWQSCGDFKAITDAKKDFSKACGR